MTRSFFVAFTALCSVISSFASGKTIPLPEHPRPDFMRGDWLNLNGEWSFAFDAQNKGLAAKWQNGGPERFPLAITVPFGWGSPLSGVAKGGNRGWYRREIEIPREWKGRRVFLVVGASDRHTDFWLDGKHLGEHEGGYTPFEFELTDDVVWGKKQAFTFRVDDSWYKWVLSGKQYNYGDVRGIWQTVYLEARGKEFVKSVRYYPDAAKGEVEALITLDAPARKPVTATLGFRPQDRKDPVKVAFAAGQSCARVRVKLPRARLWTLDDPYLHEVSVSVGDDRVETYFGLRDISVCNMPGTDIPYIALNGKPVYLRMALDQSFLPEGFYTFPSDDYARREIEIAKNLGLNGLRVHVKLEVPRKLYWADKLGILIQADIPNCWGDPSKEFFAAHRYALERAVERDFNHPALYQWTLFNETWGLMTHGKKGPDGKVPKKYLPETQETVKELFGFTKRIDPTRLVEDLSPTFNDHVVTDVNTWHTYAPGYWWEHVLTQCCKKTFPGSEWNYIGGRRQGAEPMMNSECGNVWGYKGYLGDMDWSWDYHLMMDAFRRHMKCGGFVYTEHHDVRNEWNGYVRDDRTEKFTGMDEIFPGMTMKDLHADAYIALDKEMCRVSEPGAVREIPVDISLATDEYAGKKLTLCHFLRYADSRGRINGSESDAVEDLVFEATSWQTGLIAKVSVELPRQTSAGAICFMLRDGNRTVARNFTCFSVPGKPDAFRQELKADAYTRAEWDVKNWKVMDGKKVCGVGKGFFEYTFDLPKDADRAVFRAEVASKRLYAKDMGGANTNSFTDLEIIMGKGTTNRAKNSNSYPMTSCDKWPSEVTVYANGVRIGHMTLPDDPADHRGILSWAAQKRDGYLRDAGSYGYLCEAVVPPSVIKAAKNGKIVIRLESGSKGLAVYGADFGRYPFGPTLDTGVYGDSSEKGFVISGGGVKARFSRKNGALLSLSGKDGKERVKPAAEMFTLSFLDASGDETTYRSSDFSFSRNGNVFSYRRPGGPEVDIAVRIGAGAFYFRPSVRKWPKGLTLNWIDAPQVFASTGGRLYWPMFEGAEISDFSKRRKNSWGGYVPIGWVKRGKCGGGIYPGQAQMQFLAHYSGGKGLYFAAVDPLHIQKGVEWERVSSEAIRLSLQTFCGDAVNGEYRSSFEYELRPYEGDWMAACSLYRDWVRTLPEFGKKPPLPDWAEDSPVTLIYPVKGEGMDNTKGMKPNRYYPYVNAMPDIERYAKEFDSRVMPILMHWEGTAPWCPPYVWPPFGGESKLAEFRDALHAKGHLLGVYCSGTAWTQTSSVDASYSRERQFKEEGLIRHMMRGPKGEIDASVCNGADAQRLGYDMCLSSKWTRRTLLDEAMKIAGFGIDYCQFLDQNLGGGAFLCWSREHDHTPVPGSWQTRASASLQEEIVAAIRASGSKMTIGCEAAAATPFVKNLFFNDSRAFFARFFGKPVPGVPFVFHEWMCNFSGNQCGARFDPFFRWTYSFQCGDMMSAVLGPDGKLVTAWAVPWSQPLPDQKKLVGLIRGFNDLRKRYPGHLLHGRMILPFVKVRCETADIPQSSPVLNYPKVLSSFWEDAAGSKIGFLSNWTHESVPVELTHEDGTVETVNVGPLETVVLGGARYVIVEPRRWQGEHVRNTMNTGKAMFSGLGIDYKTVKDDALGPAVLHGAKIVFISERHKLSEKAAGQLAAAEKKGVKVYKCWRWCFHEFPRLERWLMKAFPEEKAYWDTMRERNLAIRKKELEEIASLPSKKDEIRSISFHNHAWNPVIDGKEMSWDEGVKTMKDAGFNAVSSGNCAPNIARYNSKVIAMSKDVAAKGDTMDAFVAACRKYGMRSATCVRCFMSQHTDEPTPEFDRWINKDGRACIGKDGYVHKTWLCPAHPLNRELIIDACIELAEKGFDIIDLDYVRFPDTDSCRCERCRKGIAALGGDDIRYRQETIASFIRELRARLRERSPRTRLGAAVFEDPAGYGGRIGQAWDKWCAEGIVDELFPMDYVDAPADFARLVERQKKLAREVDLVPIFGPSLWADDLHDEKRASEMIDITRKAGCAGFAWFTYDNRAKRMFGTLTKGPLAPAGKTEK